jgi:FixJ family two-component response regulator
LGEIVTQRQGIQMEPLAVMLEREGFAPVARRSTSKMPDRLPSTEPVEARTFLGRLTPRELAVAIEVAKGNSNKAAAYTLGISPRTVEAHRARIMFKLRARSLADLVRLVLMASVEIHG